MNNLFIVQFYYIIYIYNFCMVYVREINKKKGNDSNDNESV